MKYVIQVEEGFFKKEETSQRVYTSIETDLQNATVYELGATPKEDLENDFFMLLLYDDAKKAGGTNPKLIPIKIQLTIVD